MRSPKRAAPARSSTTTGSGSRCATNPARPPAATGCATESSPATPSRVSRRHRDSVDGSVAGVRSSLNKAYYGKEVTPTDILIKGDVKNAQAAPLLERARELGGGK